MTSLRGVRRFAPTDRLFRLIEYLSIYLDMEVYAVCASQGAPIRPPGQHFATLIGKQFAVNVRHSVFLPFPISFTKTVVQNYELEFTSAAYTSPTVVHFSSEKWGEVATLFWNSALVFFYEQHLPWIQDTYGRGANDRDNWPPLFRFAWLLRNAAVHHHGAINLTDPMVPPVSWHHLKYDHTNGAGTKVFGDAMSMADMLIFLVELSDELDRLGCPHP